MVTWFDYMVEKERRRDERARAEEGHHSDPSSGNEKAKALPRPRRRQTALAALGRQLVELSGRTR